MSITYPYYHVYISNIQITERKKIPWINNNKSSVVEQIIVEDALTLIYILNDVNPHLNR